MDQINRGRLILVSIKDKKAEESVAAFLQKIIPDITREKANSLLQSTPRVLFSTITADVAEKITTTMAQLGSSVRFEPEVSGHVDDAKGRVIVRLSPSRDSAEKAFVYLSRLTDNISRDYVLQRLQKVPCTLLGNISQKKGVQIASDLRRIGVDASFEPETASGATTTKPDTGREKKHQLPPEQSSVAEPAAAMLKAQPVVAEQLQTHQKHQQEVTDTDTVDGAVVVTAIPTNDVQQKLLDFLAGRAEQAVIDKINDRIKSFPITVLQGIFEAEGLKLVDELKKTGAVARFVVDSPDSSANTLEDRSLSTPLFIAPSAQPAKGKVRPAHLLLALVILIVCFFATQFIMHGFFIPEDPYFNKKNGLKMMAMFEEQDKEHAEKMRQQILEHKRIQREKSQSKKLVKVEEKRRVTSSRKSRINLREGFIEYVPEEFDDYALEREGRELPSDAPLRYEASLDRMCVEWIMIDEYYELGTPVEGNYPPGIRLVPNEDPLINLCTGVKTALKDPSGKEGFCFGWSGKLWNDLQSIDKGPAIKAALREHGVSPKKFLDFIDLDHGSKSRVEIYESGYVFTNNRNKKKRYIIPVKKGLRKAFEQIYAQQ